MFGMQFSQQNPFYYGMSINMPELQWCFAVPPVRITEGAALQMDLFGCS